MVIVGMNLVPVNILYQVVKQVMSKKETHVFAPTLEHTHLAQIIPFANMNLVQENTILQTVKDAMN